MPRDVKLDAAMIAADTVREAVAGLTAKRRALAAELAELTEHTERLLSLPVRRDDARRFIFDAIDRIGAEFPHESGWDRSFAAFAYPKGDARKQTPRFSFARPQESASPLTLRDIEQASAGGAQEIEHVFGRGCTDFFIGDGNLGMGAVCRTYFFFGDIIKQRIEEHFDALFPYFNAAQAEDESTVAERRVLIDANRQRASAIELQVSEIRSQLVKLGAPVGSV